MARRKTKGHCEPSVMELVAARHDAQLRWEDCYVAGHHAAAEELETALRQAQTAYIAAETTARKNADAAYRQVMDAAWQRADADAD